MSVGANPFVCFLRPVGMDGPVKIGVSGTPVARLLTYAIISPLPLEIGATLPGGVRLEQRLYARFRTLRLAAARMATDDTRSSMSSPMCGTPAILSLRNRLRLRSLFAPCVARSEITNSRSTSTVAPCGTMDTLPPRDHAEREYERHDAKRCNTYRANNVRLLTFGRRSIPHVPAFRAAPVAERPSLSSDQCRLGSEGHPSFGWGQ